MPADTIAIVACIGAAFAFFAALLIYGDLTWDRHPAGKMSGRQK